MSMTLDRSGEARTGQVIDKSERVRVLETGDWSDDLALTGALRARQPVQRPS
jgi:hypothetical protein